MPYYDVEQYEVFKRQLRVPADSPDEAIRRVMHDRSLIAHKSAPSYLEVCMDYGQPVTELAASLDVPADDLFLKLASVDVEFGDFERDAWVKSIAGIKLSADQSD